MGLVLGICAKDLSITVSQKFVFFTDMFRLLTVFGVVWLTFSDVVDKKNTIVFLAINRVKFTLLYHLNFQVKKVFDMTVFGFSAESNF